MGSPDSSTPPVKSKYQRVLLKLSGEALAGKGTSVTDPEIIAQYAQEVAIAQQDLGVSFAIVVGGGNIWRGAEHTEMDRARADYAGMMATIINGLVLQDALRQINQEARVMSAIDVNRVAEPYILGRALRHMEKGRIPILVGGTGNPYFTTDTTASLRAAELSCQAIYMGKNGVPGVMDKDPRMHDDAVKIDEMDFLSLVTGNLGVMDYTAATFAHDKDMVMVVFDGTKPNGLAEALINPRVGTLITPQ